MKNIFILTIVCLISFTACRKDEHQINYEEEPTTETPVVKQSNITGIVTDTEGNVLANTEVNLNGVVATTDENGVYFFEKAEISSNGSLVETIKPGYIPQYKFVFNEPGELSYLNIYMIPEVTIEEFSSTEGGTFAIQEKSKITFLPNSILNEDGTVYDGQVVLKGHWYDPFTDNIVETMPGDLRGVNILNERVQLATQGMFSLDIYDTNNNELMLGKPVELSFYVGDKGVDIDGSGTMPLWYLNEDSGVWMEEGNSQLEGEFFVGEVSHFSFWNCDFPYPLTCISGIVTDVNGHDIPFADIQIVAQNNLSCGLGSTNQRGYFEAKVPAGVELIMYINGCINGIDLGAFNRDVNELGFIESDLENTGFSTSLINCESLPVAEGYVIVSVGDFTRVLYGNEQGEVFGSVATCSSQDWKVTAFDKEKYLQSNEIAATPVDSSVEIDEMWVCEDLEFYFEYEWEDGMVQITGENLENINAKIVNDNILTIHPGSEATIGGFRLIYPLTPDIPRSIFKLTQTGSSLDFVEDFELNVIKEGYGVGDIIQGSYEDENYRFRYRMKLTHNEIGSSVIVKVWDDANQNGIQEDTELPLENVRLTISEVEIQAGGSLGVYGGWALDPSFVYSNADGIVQFSGLLPDREYYLVKTNQNQFSEYSVSPESLGNDEALDSDFYEIDLNNWHATDFFYLSEGDIETSYDLGLYK